MQNLNEVNFSDLDLSEVNSKLLSRVFQETPMFAAHDREGYERNGGHDRETHDRGHERGGDHQRDSHDRTRPN